MSRKRSREKGKINYGAEREKLEQTGKGRMEPRGMVGVSASRPPSEYSRRKSGKYSSFHFRESN
jgi:hypothetical protein